VELEPRARFVPAHCDLLQLAELLAVQQPVPRADHVEATVLQDAEGLEFDGLAPLERHSLHGGDVDPDDPACHAPSLAGAYMVQRPHRERPGKDGRDADEDPALPAQAEPEEAGLIAAGAVGLAAGATMRRRRHRQHDEEPAED
jgi:hypothetical protein